MAGLGSVAAGLLAMTPVNEGKIQESFSPRIENPVKQEQVVERGSKSPLFAKPVLIAEKPKGEVANRPENYSDKMPDDFVERGRQNSLELFDAARRSAERSEQYQQELNRIDREIKKEGITLDDVNSSFDDI